MLRDYEFWFVAGSQFLYGPEVLETVVVRAQFLDGKYQLQQVYKY